MKHIDDTIGISEFAHSHPELLIIVANPETDKLFMSYGTKHVFNQIKSPEGKELHIVRDLLKRSTFGSNIDHFVITLVDIFQVSLKKANDFYQWIDGATYAISRAVSDAKGRKPETLHGKKES